MFIRSPFRARGKAPPRRPVQGRLPSVFVVLLHVGCIRVGRVRCSVCRGPSFGLSQDVGDSFIQPEENADEKAACVTEVVQQVVGVGFEGYPFRAAAETHGEVDEREQNGPPRSR